MFIEKVKAYRNELRRKRRVQRVKDCAKVAYLKVKLFFNKEL